MSNAPSFDVDRIRADFPILSREVNGKPLVYLDNGATAQKPIAVIDALDDFYRVENANIHRGVHYLSVNATDLYDRARATIAKAINVSDPAQLIFTRGTTEAINLVSNSWGSENLSEGDEILLTRMEHHANIVPWQLLAQKTGAKIVVAPITEAGELIVEEFKKLITPKTKLAGFTHISNVLGTVNPIVELCAFCREHGVTTVIDGAQGAPHQAVDLEAIGCDFYAFSGHKVFGPDGIGVLYGRRELLEAMPPYQSGGDMVEQVSFEKTTFKGIPERFEAGTPNISGAIGLAAAFDYLETLDSEAVHRHEQQLLAAATAALTEIEGLKIQGTTPGKVSIISFTVAGIHPHDLGTILDSEGVAVRAGNHCAQPLMAFYGIPSSARASFAFYNTLDEVETLARAVRKAHKYFA
ncbi:MAG: cysteine desulfurase/selenocysteine lyase [Verrucomicrobiales bacterium]